LSQPSRPRPPDPSRATWTTRRILKRAAGAILVVGLTVLLIGQAFYRVQLQGGLRVEPRFDIGEWFADLPGHLGWVALFALLTASMAPLRALRWGFVLPRPKPAYSDRYHAVAIGLLANNAIPGKLGEAVRGLSLSRFSAERGRDLPFAQSLASCESRKGLPTRWTFGP